MVSVPNASSRRASGERRVPNWKRVQGNGRQTPPLTMGRFLPPDHSKGDPNTIGGYMAVHDRPAAFEGSDGASYSVEIVTDTSGEKDRPFAAYLLFVRWRQGDPVASGLLASEYLSYASDEAAGRPEAG